MTTPENQKNESGLFTFLASVIKKSAELPEDVTVLSSTVKQISEDLRDLTTSVAKIVQTVYEHHIAIANILEVQEQILLNMKADKEKSRLLSIDVKHKQQKPN